MKTKSKKTMSIFSESEKEIITECLRTIVKKINYENFGHDSGGYVKLYLSTHDHDEKVKEILDLLIPIMEKESKFLYAYICKHNEETPSIVINKRQNFITAGNVTQTPCINDWEDSFHQDKDLTITMNKLDIILRHDTDNLFGKKLGNVFNKYETYKYWKDPFFILSTERNI